MTNSLLSIEYLKIIARKINSNSGGILITDWYSDNENLNESIKISIRFLTNEVRSDALDIKVFHKKCALVESCAISERSGQLVAELNKKILQKAAVYQKDQETKSFKPYRQGNKQKD